MERYTLSEGEYYKLLSHVERVAKLEAEARATQQAQQMAIAEAAAKKKQIFDALAVKYGFDPMHALYQLNDETLELVALEAGPAPAP